MSLPFVVMLRHSQQMIVCPLGALQLGAKRYLPSIRGMLKAVENLAKEAPEIAVTVQSVADLNEILRYEILGTPALLINERVIAVGKVLRTEEILAHLRTVLADHAVATLPGA